MKIFYCKIKKYKMGLFVIGGIIVGLGALILGGLGIYYGFAEWGVEGKSRWKSMGILMSSIVLFVLSIGLILYHIFSPRRNAMMKAKGMMGSIAAGNINKNDIMKYASMAGIQCSPGVSGNTSENIQSIPQQTVQQQPATQPSKQFQQGFSSQNTFQNYFAK